MEDDELVGGDDGAHVRANPEHPIGKYNTSYWSEMEDFYEFNAHVQSGYICSNAIAFNPEKPVDD